MKERTIEILNRVINSSFPVNFKYLADEFQLSTRTIRNEIDSINEYLGSHGFNLITNSRSDGLCICIDENEREELILLLSDVTEYYSREERMLDIILAVSLSNQQIYLYKKEEEFQVSKSTIDEDMRTIRSFLDKYKIELLSVPKNGLVMTGNERSIRTMVFAIINKYTNGLLTLNSKDNNITSIINKYFHNDLYNQVDNIVDQHVSFRVEDIYRKNFNLLICIWLRRIKLNHVLLKESNKESLSPTKNIQTINAIIDNLISEYDVNPPLEEIKYIQFMLQSLDIVEGDNNFDWVNSQIITMQLIHYVEEYTSIPFTTKEGELQSGIYNHLKSMIPRIQNNLQFSNPLTKTIQITYGEVFNAVKAYVQSISHLTKNRVTDDEIAFLTIHFSAALSELKQENQYWFRSVVICNHGMATGKLLAEKLQELFNIEVIGVFSSREMETVRKLDVDLVFSTVDISISAFPSLKVDPILSDIGQELVSQFLIQNDNRKRIKTIQNDYTYMFQEINKIIENIKNNENENYYKEIESIFNRNDLHINKKELQPMIKDILIDSDIQLQMEVDNWEDSIVKVAEPLLDREVITQEYVDAMINSVKEYGAYIVIGPHFALAHARPEDGANEIGLSMATLKKPVIFGNEENDPVSLIFCLSAVDAHSHLNIMKEIVNLINNPEKITKLSKIVDIEEFKNELLRK